MSDQPSEQSVDRPNVIVFPPVLLAATIAAACALQWATPLGLVAAINQNWRISAGVVLVIAGAAVMISGRNALKRRGTNVNPLRPATALATEGIYKWTRNPMYSGGMVLMTGIALAFAIDWLVLLMLPSALILHFGVVLREERYLDHKFCDEYRRYRDNVPRYV
jgi:protein-S-isoprenylcysteine O-methyltransferase Ste14